VPKGDVMPTNGSDYLCSLENDGNIAMPNRMQGMRRVPFAEIVPANRAVVGLAYVAGYVALDRISFVEPYASFGITPWNPNTGLSFVLVLFFDIWMVPLLFVAPFMADLINRQINLP
jgi:hypothetical protein